MLSFDDLTNQVTGGALQAPPIPGVPPQMGIAGLPPAPGPSAGVPPVPEGLRGLLASLQVPPAPQGQNPMLTPANVRVPAQTPSNQPPPAFMTEDMQKLGGIQDTLNRGRQEIGSNFGELMNTLDAERVRADESSKAQETLEGGLRLRGPKGEPVDTGQILGNLITTLATPRQTAIQNLMEQKFGGGRSGSAKRFAVDLLGSLVPFFPRQITSASLINQLDRERKNSMELLTKLTGLEGQTTRLRSDLAKIQRGELQDQFKNRLGLNRFALDAETKKANLEQANTMADIKVLGMQHEWSADQQNLAFRYQVEKRLAQKQAFDESPIGGMLKNATSAQAVSAAAAMTLNKFGVNPMNDAENASPEAQQYFQDQIAGLLKQYAAERHPQKPAALKRLQVVASMQGVNPSGRTDTMFLTFDPNTGAMGRTYGEQLFGQPGMSTEERQAYMNNKKAAQDYDGALAEYHTDVYENKLKTLQATGVFGKAMNQISNRLGWNVADSATRKRIMETVFKQLYALSGKQINEKERADLESMMANLNQNPSVAARFLNIQRVASVKDLLEKAPNTAAEVMGFQNRGNAQDFLDSGIANYMVRRWNNMMYGTEVNSDTGFGGVMGDFLDAKRVGDQTVMGKLAPLVKKVYSVAEMHNYLLNQNGGNNEYRRRFEADLAAKRAGRARAADDPKEWTPITVKRRQ